MKHKNSTNTRKQNKNNTVGTEVYKTHWGRSPKLRKDTKLSQTGTETCAVQCSSSSRFATDIAVFPQS